MTAAAPTVQQIMPGWRLDQIVGSGDPSPSEAHDMAVEILNWRMKHGHGSDVPPTPVVAALRWSEPRKGDGKEFFQDHCLATCSLGVYTIEWKSWKGEDDGHVVDSTLGWVGCGCSLDEAKALAQADYERRVLSALDGQEPWKGSADDE